MGHLSSSAGIKPRLLAAGRDRIHSLSFANPAYVAERSANGVTRSQPAGLVHSLIPNHLHPLEIAHMPSASLSACVNPLKSVLSAPATSGTRLPTHGSPTEPGCALPLFSQHYFSASERNANQLTST